MKYRGLISFAGNITMYKGEVRELSKKDAASLLSCGYIEAVSEKPAKKDKEDGEENK